MFPVPFLLTLNRWRGKSFFKGESCYLALASIFDSLTFKLDEKRVFQVVNGFGSAGSLAVEYLSATHASDPERGLS
jgi:hypothetical protein